MHETNPDQMKERLTEEQLDAISAFGNGENLRINAFAGTGKTFTLRIMSQSSNRNGMYLAFNKSIANEAKRSFPDSVEVLTSHALAFRAVIKMGYSESKMTGKMNAKSTAKALKLSALSCGKHTIRNSDFGFLVNETVRNFAYSDKHEITPDLVSLPDKLSQMASKHKYKTQIRVSDQAKKLWSYMIDPDNDCFPLGHDGYFKVWALSRPVLQVDFILLDEAQDSNPALLSVLSIQQAQVVFVGDRFQQIYAWRGAINAMEENQIDQSLSLTYSFRFGHIIADFATRVANLLDPHVVIHGDPNIDSKFGCTSPDIFISRTNASIIEKLMESLESGLIPFVLGGVDNLRWMLEDISLLKADLPSTHPEFLCFKNWDDVTIFSKHPAGEHLRGFVRVVEKYDEINILKALSKTAKSEQSSNVILSTTHKAKGREWSSVFLTDDFPEPIIVTEKNENKLLKKGYVFISKEQIQVAFLPEEIRILYVASTRAKRELRIPAWCASFFEIHDLNATSSQCSMATDIKDSDIHLQPTTVEYNEESKEKLTTRKNSPSLNVGRYAVIDFETTGLSPQHGDRALEVGVAIIENGLVKDTYQSLMNPGVAVPSFITGLTGITQKMISKAPASEMVMKEVCEFIGNTWLVAHNASFDKRFWDYELNKINLGSENKFLCTMLISRRLYPWANDHKLETLVNVHDIKVQGKHHRALADSLMAAELFIQAQKDLGLLYEPENITPEFILSYQKKPKAKLKSAIGIKQGDIKSSSRMRIKDVVESEEFKNDLSSTMYCAEGNLYDVEDDFQNQLMAINDYYRIEIKELKGRIARKFLKERRAELRARQKDEKDQLKEFASSERSDIYEEMESEIAEALKEWLLHFGVTTTSSDITRISKRIASSEVKKIKVKVATLKKAQKEKQKTTSSLKKPVSTGAPSTAKYPPSNHSRLPLWDWVAYSLLIVVAFIIITELI